MPWTLTQSPPDVVEALGISGWRSGDGVAVVVSNDSVDFWSRAHGFGFDRPIDSALIAEILDGARAGQARVMNFHLGPEALPAHWAEIWTEHGLVTGGTWVKRFAGPVRWLRSGPTCGSG